MVIRRGMVKCKGKDAQTIGHMNQKLYHLLGMLQDRYTRTSAASLVLHDMAKTNNTITFATEYKCKNQQ